MTVDGSPLRTAIRQALLDSPNLTALLADPDNGVFYQLASGGSELPYVIFQEQTDVVPLWTCEGPPLETGSWMVKAVGSVAATENILAQIKATLDRAELVIEGSRSLYCNRTSCPPPYAEVTSGQRIQHAGAVYKITTEEEA